MEQEEFVFSKIEGIDLTMQTQAKKNMTLLRGKAVLNEECKNFTFLQNPPRGPRSVEVCRTAHSRMVRRPDGDYTLTIRFDASEKYVREALLSELRDVVKAAGKDKENLKTKEKEAKDESDK